MIRKSVELMTVDDISQVLNIPTEVFSFLKLSHGPPTLEADGKATAMQIKMMIPRDLKIFLICNQTDISELTIETPN